MDLAEKAGKFNNSSVKTAEVGKYSPQPIARRGLIKGMPAALVASSPMTVAAVETDRDRMIRVITQLEAWQDWEPSSVVAAKAFAARQMRKALGLDLPDPEHAQAHIDFQRQKFEDYRRTVWFDQECADGRTRSFPLMEDVLE